MEASGWSTVIEQGGAYLRHFRRRIDGATDAESIAAPVEWRWYHPGTSRVVARVVGSVGRDLMGPFAEIRLSSAETELLPAGVWDYRLTVGDPALNDVIVLARGTVRVRDSL